MKKVAFIKPVPILSESQYSLLPFPKEIKILRKGYYVIIDTPIGGDAPKDFIRVYEYTPNSKIRKVRPKSWSTYIAKVGHKHYPMESVTEYLLNQIGETMGFKMAESKLMHSHNQLRFLSKYFLTNPDNILDHGAQIFASYLGDIAFAEEVEEKGFYLYQD